MAQLQQLLALRWGQCLWMVIIIAVDPAAVTRLTGCREGKVVLEGLERKSVMKLTYKGRVFVRQGIYQ